MRPWLHRLREWWSHPRLRLGKPIRLSGDVTLSFRGQGKARFRVQHTGDLNGQPDEVAWCDVSLVSNGLVPREVAIDLSECCVRGMFIEQVNGNQDALYRWHSAGWLRVLPYDDDVATRKSCERYAVRVRAA